MATLGVGVSLGNYTKPDDKSYSRSPEWMKTVFSFVYYFSFFFPFWFNQCCLQQLDNVGIKLKDGMSPKKKKKRKKKVYVYIYNIVMLEMLCMYELPRYIYIYICM